jgi:hypothetical protein
MQTEIRCKWLDKKEKSPRADNDEICSCIDCRCDCTRMRRDCTQFLLGLMTTRQSTARLSGSRCGCHRFYCRCRHAASLRLYVSAQKPSMNTSNRAYYRRAALHSGECAQSCRWKPALRSMRRSQRCSRMQAAWTSNASVPTSASETTDVVRFAGRMSRDEHQRAQSVRRAP